MLADSGTRGAEPESLGSRRQELDEASTLGTLAPDRPRDLYTGLLLGHLSSKLRDFSKAEEFYSRIIGEPKAPTSLQWEAQAGLAEVHAAQGKDALAINEFNASIKTITKTRDALQHESFASPFFSSAIRFYDAYVNFLIDRHRPLDALKLPISAVRKLSNKASPPLLETENLRLHSRSTPRVCPPPPRRVALLLARPAALLCLGNYSRKRLLSICCLQALRLMRP